METKTKKGFNRFIKDMESILQQNQSLKDDSWVTMDINFLKNKLLDNAIEYFNEPRKDKKKDILINIANYSMMLYNRHLQGDT